MSEYKPRRAVNFGHFWESAEDPPRQEHELPPRLFNFLPGGMTFDGLAVYYETEAEAMEALRAAIAKAEGGT